MTGRYQSVSVVIPTYNRRSGLERALSALATDTARSSRGLVEVVVVDDGSSDGTHEWLRAQRYPFAVQALRQANAGPAAARNAGLRAATGELIMFIDDDTEPQPGLLEAHLAAHGDARNCAVIGPLKSLPEYPEPWVTWEQRQLEKQYRSMSVGKFEPTFRQFWTGNASVAREHVLAAGGFDPGYLRAEDVELGFRMSRRGLVFRFQPEAVVLHHARRSLAAFSDAQRRYGALEYRMYAADHPQLLVGNWKRLHPLTRALVGANAGFAWARATIASLQAALVACQRASATATAMPLCSLLANVLFWDSMARTVGRRCFRALVTGPGDR